MCMPSPLGRGWMTGNDALPSHALPAAAALVFTSDAPPASSLPPRQGCSPPPPSPSQIRITKSGRPKTGQGVQGRDVPDTPNKYPQNDLPQKNGPVHTETHAHTPSGAVCVGRALRRGVLRGCNARFTGACHGGIRSSKHCSWGRLAAQFMSHQMSSGCPFPRTCCGYSGMRSPVITPPPPFVTESPSVVPLRGPGQPPAYSSPHDAVSIFSRRSAKPLSPLPHHFCFSIGGGLWWSRH